MPSRATGFSLQLRLWSGRRAGWLLCDADRSAASSRVELGKNRCWTAPKPTMATTKMPQGGADHRPAVPHAPVHHGTEAGCRRGPVLTHPSPRNGNRPADALLEGLKARKAAGQPRRSLARRPWIGQQLVAQAPRSPPPARRPAGRWHSPGKIERVYSPVDDWAVAIGRKLATVTRVPGQHRPGGAGVGQRLRCAGALPAPAPSSPAHPDGDDRTTDEQAESQDQGPSEILCASYRRTGVHAGEEGHRQHEGDRDRATTSRVRRPRRRSTPPAR